WILFRELFPPLQRAGSRVMTRKNSTDSKRVNFSVVDHRRGLRTFSVTGSSRMHCVGNRLTLSPDLLAGGSVEAKQHFLFTLPRELIDSAVYYDGRSVTDTDRNLPFLFQCLWPRVGHRSVGDFCIAVWATPLRPICNRA